jgi:ABC-type multidrug transport system permease subunit
LGLQKDRYLTKEGGGRVNFTSSNYLSRVKIFLTLFVAFVIAALVVIIATSGVTYTTLITVLGASILSYLIVSYIYSHSQSASLKGDTLIFSSMKKRSSVMSVGTVRKVKSRCFFGLCSTFIRYKIDGRTNWLFILTPEMQTSPEKVINQALELKRENKKANHKPGSVITQHA